MVSAFWHWMILTENKWAMRILVLRRLS